MVALGVLVVALLLVLVLGLGSMAVVLMGPVAAVRARRRMGKWHTMTRCSMTTMSAMVTTGLAR